MLRRLFFHHQRGYRSLAFVLVGVVSIATYGFVVRIPDGSIPGWVLGARREAVQTTLRGDAVLAELRQSRRLPINPGDQFQTGLIGIDSSPITTDLGSLASARTSTDPVFAAALVQMLYEAGVRPGGVVAVGTTGSYPAFDLDVYAAVEAVGARPVTISSVGSTQYGANEPQLSWPTMEKALFDAGVIHSRSAAVTAGGSLAGKGAAVRMQIAERSGLPTLPVLPLTQDIHYREHLYQQAADEAGTTIAAFVDVGGAAANVGSSSSESIITPGLSSPQWSQYQASHLGVVGWMAIHGIPIVAMINVKSLAQTFGIPYDPALRDTARDLAAPPADPIALVTALLFLVILVVGFHRAGLFRVPDWELPLALRRFARRSGSATAQDPTADAPAKLSSNGHRPLAVALASTQERGPTPPPTHEKEVHG